MSIEEIIEGLRNLYECVGPDAKDAEALRQAIQTLWVMSEPSK